jgi:hypothetical protein
MNPKKCEHRCPLCIKCHVQGCPRHIVPPQEPHRDEWEKELEQIDFGITTPHSTAELLHYSETIKSFIRSLLSTQAIELTREHVGIAHEMKKARNMPGMDGGEYDQALDDFIKTIAKKYD